MSAVGGGGLRRAASSGSASSTIARVTSAELGATWNRSCAFISIASKVRSSRGIFEHNGPRQRLFDCLAVSGCVGLKRFSTKRGSSVGSPSRSNRSMNRHARSRRPDRLIEHVEQMVGALPRRHHIFIDMVAAIDDHVVEQLAHQVEHRADRDVGHQLAFFDSLGRRQQIDARRMLGQRRLELDRVELLVEPHQRHDRHLGFEIEKDGQAAGLQVEIDQRDAFVQRRAAPARGWRPSRSRRRRPPGSSPRDHAALVALGGASATRLLSAARESLRPGPAV